MIELLATILILAIIMIVAVPNVMSTIDKNKQNTYVEDAKRMITLAEYKVRSDTNIPLPTTNGSCIVVLMSALDLSEFSDPPEGGNYNLDNSYVVIARTGSTYTYLASLEEDFDGSKRGIKLATRDELNKENARKLVVKDADLNLSKPTVGSQIASYNVINVIDS